MIKVLILGAGGHAQVLADILRAMREAGEPIEIIGFLDDNPNLWGQKILRYPVLGPIKNLISYPHDAVIIGIGDNFIRQDLHVRLKNKGETFITAIHPCSTIAPDVIIGPGTMICAGVVVNTGTVIGEGVILNTGCTVDHHNRIGSFAHIAPGVHLGGGVQIDEGVLVGIGASVLPGIYIGSWAVIGGGAVVIRDVAPNATVVGVPGKVIYPK